MSVVSVPLYEDYWIGPTKVPQIAEIRPIKRFRKLQRYIHFVILKKRKILHIDFFKAHPILDMIRNQCLKIKEENKLFCDETMIAFKGTKAGNIHQYISSKHKRGFTFFCSGWCISFYI